ncbi:glycoside hydrolase family 16 protein [Pseudonocardia sp. EC080625-04]|uniref:glycoside hydrolase family 16 protein n=1 Tax=Pseudonocardia sp. EC080625-04 TaxID=1096868 RepID=UPI0007610C4D|nr:glycoside hydrolase family 16 protein [Pseudonocardia sp. EC080625-04]
MGLLRSATRGVSLRRVSTALALTTSVAASGLSPAATQEGVECGWRITAVHVLAELTGDTSERAEKLRTALLEVGANEPDFVPQSCYETGSSSGSGSSSGTGSGSESGSGSGTGSGDDSGDAAGSGADDSGSSPGSGDDGGSGAGAGSGENGSGTGSGAGGGSGSSSGSGSGSGSSSTGQGQTAAEAFGWGEPDKVDEFENGIEGWNLYDGPGHAGNGTRSPEAASVADGLLTIDGTGDGTTGGMAWGDGQQYGRWEGRVRAPKGSPSYNALLLLWPTAENFPVGGEIDFMEIMDAERNKVELFLHYGEDNSQVHGEVEVDATQWNNWAVEWTPEGVTAFLNGEEWWKTTDTSILPPGPMHLCIQLDWFPKGDSDTGQMQVDWVKQWSLGEGESSSTDSAGSEGSTDADSSTTITDETNNWGGRMFGIR